MKNFNLVAMILMIVGGINWGLIGFFNYNAVTSLFGDASAMTKVVYCLVGLCALYEAWQFMRKKDAAA
jgi:uncharacterized membrane protein YuzA (DUF378 family)